MKPTTWQDSKGNQWNCKINLSDCIRLKESNGFDLMNPRDFERMLQDTMKQIETIAELLRPQWERQGMNYLQFIDILIEEEDDSNKFNRHSLRRSKKIFPNQSEKGNRSSGQENDGNDQGAGRKGLESGRVKGSRRKASATDRKADRQLAEDLSKLGS